MANLKEVRTRIASVNSTQQITKAMKMVSAAKLRRAQEGIQQLRPYAIKLREILDNLAESAGGDLAKVREEKNILIVPVCSNRGLCGAFNANVIRTVNKLIAEQFAEQHAEGNVKVLCVGKKASDFFSKKMPSVYIGQHNDVFDSLSFSVSAPIAEKIMADFVEEKYDKVVVVYNQFKNAAVQSLEVEQLLPLQPEAESNEAAKKKMVNDYIFEPGKEEILLELIPKSIKTQLYKSFLDSNASEHGARMTAMNKATDNAGELLKDLRLTYNKARQAAITTEILEIVGGAEALNS
ncbi:MAG: ATP synthase F1 subunit gamma [Bacteroidia bacterium]|nr:ATP synthase F1 subunit gamma [Bacteroidia bacterium]